MIAVGLLGGVGLCGLGLLFWATLSTSYEAADYPGAIQVSDHGLYRFLPNLHLRRDTSYRAAAEFPELYNWYSQRFQLGPEARAESACITMEKADRVLLLERVTTVTLCDTGPSRRIYVTRTFTLRFR